MADVKAEEKPEQKVGLTKWKTAMNIYKNGSSDKNTIMMRLKQIS